MKISELSDSDFESVRRFICDPSVFNVIENGKIVDIECPAIDSPLRRALEAEAAVRAVSWRS